MKYNYIISIIVTILVLNGCTKDLDLIPKDTISDGTFWKSASDFKLAANNLYYSFNPGNTNADWIRDLESDIAYGVNNSFSNGTYQVTETDANWSTPYTYIRRCNNIIEKAAKAQISDDIKQFVAEAKFFRAFNYWQLYRFYGGVPLITSVLDISSEALYTTRATRKETVDFILKDLTEAAVDLPLKSALASADIGRMTKGSAEALKARVALFEGTWGKYRGDANANSYLDIAIASTLSVMNSTQYSLYTGKGQSSYRYLFIDEGDNASECIIDCRYQMDILMQKIPQYVNDVGYLPTKKLADMYLCSDGLPINKSTLFQGYNLQTSEFQNRDPRMTMTIIIPGTKIVRILYPTVPEVSYPFYPQRNGNTGYCVYKFLSEDPNGNARQSWGFDQHVLRYAEVLLIYAEASIERNGTISDADLDKSINIIRQRVNMPALTNAFVSANGLDMKTEIRRERTIELALEGFRYDDLRRWKTAETELPTDIKGIKIVGSEWTNPIIINGVNRNPYAGASWQSNTDVNGFIIAEKASGRYFDPSKHYLRPLPTKEIAINSKLEQNPGW